MIDIKGNSKDPRAARLSNFTPRSFIFDGVICADLEGFLQALKCSDAVRQEQICLMDGRVAKAAGQAYNTWKETQELWWQGKVYHRASREYQELITRVYDAVFMQDGSFTHDLIALGFEPIEHSIGNQDMRDTVLTEIEMLYQLNRLRIIAFRDYSPE